MPDIERPAHIVCRAGRRSCERIISHSRTGTRSNGWDAGRRGAKHSRHPLKCDFNREPHGSAAVAKWSADERRSLHEHRRHSRAVALRVRRCYGGDEFARGWKGFDLPCTCKAFEPVARVMRISIATMLPANPLRGLGELPAIFYAGIRRVCSIMRRGTVTHATPATSATPATPATSATNVSKGGTPRSPVGRKKAAHLCPSKAVAATMGTRGDGRGGNA